MHRQPTDVKRWAGPMSALGQKRTWRDQIAMSALPPKADIADIATAAGAFAETVIRSMIDSSVRRARCCPSYRLIRSDSSTQAERR
jgi:hypothetical protein